MRYALALKATGTESDTPTSVAGTAADEHAPASAAERDAAAPVVREPERKRPRRSCRAAE